MLVIQSAPALLSFPLQQRNLSPAEALRTMPSSNADRASFEMLALPLIPSLFNHATWLARNRHEAEDLVQETLTKALRAFDSFQSSTNFKAWIFRILRNTFLTSRTAISASRTEFLEEQPASFEIAATGPSPEEYVIQMDDAAVVQTALEELPPLLREALLLCEVEEMRYKEIALVLDVPIGTVMSRISRARDALRRILQIQPGGRG